MSFYKPIKGVIWKLKLSKKMNWQTTAEEMKLANKHEKLKKQLKKKIKMPVMHYLSPVRLAKMKKISTILCGKKANVGRRQRWDINFQALFLKNNLIISVKMENVNCDKIWRNKHFQALLVGMYIGTTLWKAIWHYLTNYKHR